MTSYSIDDLLKIRDGFGPSPYQPWTITNYQEKKLEYAEQIAYIEETSVSKLKAKRDSAQKIVDIWTDEIEKIDRRIEHLEKPTEPGVGQLIRFSKKEHYNIYHYAGISFWRNGEIRWAITGRNWDVSYTWESLLQFIGRDRWGTLEVASDFEEIE